MNVKRKIKEIGFYISKRDPISKVKILPTSSKKVLGDKNASWVIPEDVLDEKSICYLAGAGENISFDIELYSEYNCKTLILDPTPRAIAHYNGLKDDFKFNCDKLNFLEVGLWKENTVIKFYSPANKKHVSHSIVNLQKTEDFFEGEVRTLKTVMANQGDSEIDLLKIDIEGAEYKVIESLIADKVFPRVLCIEYDEIFNPMDEFFNARIKESLLLLMENGYSIFHLDYPSNYTLIRDL